MTDGFRKLIYNRLGGKRRNKQRNTYFNIIHISLLVGIVSSASYKVSKSKETQNMKMPCKLSLKNSPTKKF